MSGDTREMVIQLIVGALCAALFYALPLRAHRRPHARVLQLVVALAIVALVVIGLVEARVVAAVLAGAGVGILLAGAATVTRAAQSGAVSVVTTARRALGLLGTVAVAVLPLVVLGKTTASESVMRLTRAAAANSDGSWVIAWQRSWAFLLDPDHVHLRVSVVGSWTLLVAVGFVAIAIALSRVIRWRLAALAPATTASVGADAHLAPAPALASVGAHSADLPVLAQAVDAGSTAASPR